MPNKDLLCFQVFKIFFSKLIEKLPKENNVTYETYRYTAQTFENSVTELKERSLKCKLGSIQENLTKTVLKCGIENNATRDTQLQNNSAQVFFFIKQIILDLKIVVTNTKTKAFSI